MSFFDRKQTGGLISKEWNEASPQKLAKFIAEYKSAKGLERSLADTYVETGCEYYVNSKDYTRGDTTLGSYKVCCEMVDYCSWYIQTWFYFIIGGSALLCLIICIIISCCCCCMASRRNGGKDELKKEEDDTSDED